MDGPVKVVEACSEHTGALSQSVEGGASDSGSDGRVWEGVIAAVYNALPFTFDCKTRGSVCHIVTSVRKTEENDALRNDGDKRAALTFSQLFFMRGELITNLETFALFLCGEVEWVCVTEED